MIRIDSGHGTPDGLIQTCLGPVTSYHQKCRFLQDAGQVNIRASRFVERRVMDAGNNADHSLPVGRVLRRATYADAFSDRTGSWP